MPVASLVAACPSKAGICLNSGGSRHGMKPYRTILILLVLAAAIWIDLPNNPGVHILGINRDVKTSLGLDLVGGVQVLLEADVPADQTVDSVSMDTVRTIVENRVNGLGVTESVVVRAGERRVVVELPGVEDPERAKSTIKETALLEFVDMSSISQDEAQALQDSGTIIITDLQLGSVVSPTAGVTSTGTISSTTVDSREWHTVMTGKELKTAGVELQNSDYVVAFELSGNGATTFSDFTSTHVGQVLAIVLDNKIISAPKISTAITDGKGIITGNFTRDSANQLAVQLRYGALPIPLKVVETRTVGPSLGQDSLRKSLIAGLVGFIIVVLFMALYYRLPGLVADLAIVIYALITFALYRFIPVTLTLPGIAGFLLSTGSALDANILIFERMKEELRLGKTLRQAMEQGWSRAWPSIRDSNIATLITCLILWYFGSTSGATIVKGFSLTLLFGIGVSLFTAIVVTRTLLSLVLGYFKPTNYERWFGI
jgi:preprotein translocase subunit SecD